MSAGYSSRSLTDKLGIKPGMSLLLINATPTLIAALPKDVVVKQVTSPAKATSSYDYIHLFSTEEAHVADTLALLKRQLKENGMIWVSWPKKSARKLAGIDTDLTEDVIRDHALRTGLVDVKVCAIDKVWSALKLVIPIANRKRSG